MSTGTQPVSTIWMWTSQCLFLLKMAVTPKTRYLKNISNLLKSDCLAYVRHFCCPRLVHILNSCKMHVYASEDAVVHRERGHGHFWTSIGALRGCSSAQMWLLEAWTSLLSTRWCSSTHLARLLSKLPTSVAESTNSNTFQHVETSLNHLLAYWCWSWLRIMERTKYHLHREKCWKWWNSWRQIWTFSIWLFI